MFVFYPANKFIVSHYASSDGVPIVVSALKVNYREGALLPCCSFYSPVVEILRSLIMPKQVEGV